MKTGSYCFPGGSKSKSISTSRLMRILELVGYWYQEYFPLTDLSAMVCAYYLATAFFLQRVAHQKYTYVR